MRFIAIRGFIAMCLSALSCGGYAATCAPYNPLVPTSAEAIAAAAAWTAFADAAAKSSDLRLRVAIPHFGLVECEDGLVFDAPDPEVAGLVDLARGSTDPMVLGAMAERCRHSGPDGRRRCDALDFADRWTIADSQNAAAWLMQATIRKQRGDASGFAASLQRAAHAATWHTVGVDRMRVVLHALPSSMAPRDQVGILIKASGYIYGMAWSRSAILRDACANPETRAICAQILDTMSRDAENVVDLRISSIYTARIGAADAIVQARYRHADALSWIAREVGNRTNPDAEDDATISRALAVYRQRFAIGEVTSLEIALQAGGVTEEEAARRYLEAFTPQQLARQMAIRGQATEAHH